MWLFFQPPFIVPCVVIRAVSALKIVQFLRNGAVHLTFKSSVESEGVLASGIRYGYVPPLLALAGTQAVLQIIYLRNYPSEIPDEVACQCFTSFGKVHSVSHRTYQGSPQVVIWQSCRPHIVVQGRSWCGYHRGIRVPGLVTPSARFLRDLQEARPPQPCLPVG